jgi:hypothetical protein
LSNVEKKVDLDCWWFFFGFKNIYLVLSATVKNFKRCRQQHKFFFTAVANSGLKTAIIFC